ncbi:right-handed parallel beta-helix repeat-containing protein [Clostridium sp. SHJSY1]|uniref:right-handed parallel beta-helix repeat-containing protein n=1 Tax=Clostridium sp. SHJSY1 TaxID=2942483 RepID=UPI0028740437|nr:right-handed parallel beta-helix repeat-containing protein [Clostridium sp. SHJSY1]MDS0524670.1 right-handed parallel beta-helix repeat-containing protein [Clostridium sp. SHJSY1]
MKKVKVFCLGIALALSVATVSNYTVASAATSTKGGSTALSSSTLSTVNASSYTVVKAASTTGKTVTVKNGGTTLENALKSAKSGDTIVVTGTVKSKGVTVPAGVTIKGQSNGKIDFSGNGTSRGLTVNTNGSTIQDLEICNAGDNGIYVQGSSNKFINLNVHNNKDAGVQISNGGANNYLSKVHSHHNADAKGENADGFAIKLHSGVGNVLEDCIAEYNSDDGYDLYAAHGAVKFIRCQANYNGECDGIKGDGNGFKLGGVDNKTDGVAAHLDPLKHYLENCSAKGNKASGFDRNNQNGVVTMKSCTSDSNGKKNYNWPLTGSPSALGKKVTFGKALIQDCTSKSGSNDISGATLSGKCTGF